MDKTGTASLSHTGMVAGLGLGHLGLVGFSMALLRWAGERTRLFWDGQILVESMGCPMKFARLPLGVMALSMPGCWKALVCAGIL